MAGFVALTDIYVEIIQARVKDPAGVQEVYARWVRDVAPGADGWLASTAGISDEGEFIAVVRFASEQAARLNRSRPQQDSWWREMSQQLADDARFIDCAAVATFGEDRPGDPGFVQAVQGQAAKLPGVLEQVAETAQHHIFEHHLDVLGGLIADHGDGGFTEVVYYPSPEAARHGESGNVADRDVTLVERLAGFVADLRYLNLADPWHHRAREVAADS